MSENKLISTSSDWTFELLKEYDTHIGRIAHDKFNLDTYPNQIEIVSSEQMIDAYTAIGMPVNYHHWSFGKDFVKTQKDYKRGEMGLAYEIVINSNPCVAYLMEENSLTMQALVIAHASYGHNSFFKGNYLFKNFTDPESIVDYLAFAKNYITECEEKYGRRQVEDLLDSCHALKRFGIDKYARPEQLSLHKEKERQKEREAFIQSQVNELWKTVPKKDKKGAVEYAKRKEPLPREPEDNILYFLEMHAPLLEPWEREIIRIIRSIATYFYPQAQDSVMNEGWATFWHYTILNEMYDEGLVNDGFMLEFLKSHTSVTYQPEWYKRYYHGLNVYALGFNTMKDIKRICQAPTDEDKKWFPDIAGSPWLKTMDYIMRNFRDESYLYQFLSPKVIRDMRLFVVNDNDLRPKLSVRSIHNDDGYKDVRKSISNNYNISLNIPDIKVYRANIHTNNQLILRHYQYNRVPLNSKETSETLKHIARLWGHSVRLESIDPSSGTIVSTEDCIM